MLVLAQTAALSVLEALWEWVVVGGVVIAALGFLTFVIGMEEQHLLGESRRSNVLGVVGAVSIVFGWICAVSAVLAAYPTLSGGS